MYTTYPYHRPVYVKKSRSDLSKVYNNLLEVDDHFAFIHAYIKSERRWPPENMKLLSLWNCKSFLKDGYRIYRIFLLILYMHEIYFLIIINNILLKLILRVHLFCEYRGLSIMFLIKNQRARHSTILLQIFFIFCI